MRTLKTFSNVAEAGFAHSLLEAAGLHPFLADELTGGLQNPGISQGIRLQINETEYEQALRVLAEGPGVVLQSSGNPAEPPAGRPAEPRVGGRIPVGLFAAIAVIFIGICYAVGSLLRERDNTVPADWVGEHIKKFDHNHDGRPDYFVTYRDGKIVHTETDRNHDGKIDEWHFYGSDGTEERAEYDENLDGKPDLWNEYRNGMQVASRQDTDFNGIPDIFSTYKGGFIDHTDIRPNDSPVVIRRLFYTNNILREQWVDEDADGKFDYRIEYDPFGKPSEHLPMPETK